MPISRRTRGFRELMRVLPPEVREAAKKQFHLWLADTDHPSVWFKQLKPDLWSARVTQRYRALARPDGENAYVWFWIGPHGGYDRRIKAK